MEHEGNMYSGRERMSGRPAASRPGWKPGFLAGAMTGAVMAAAAASLSSTDAADARQPARASVDTLLTTSKTVAGEAITYPVNAPAKITAAIITLPSGASTGWHTHGVPLFGYILEGELTVDYGVQGVRTYRAGDGFMEAEEAPHDGRNAGTGDARILAVYMGAEGLGLSHEAAAPRP